MLTEEFNKLIAEHIDQQLPKHVGDRLKKRLEKISEFENTISQMDEHIHKLEAEIEKQDKRIVELVNTNDKLAARIHVIEPKEASLEDLERNLLKRQIELEKCELVVGFKDEYMKERLSDMKELVKCVFANNRFKYHTTEDVFTPVPGRAAHVDQHGYGQPGEPGYVDHDTKTKTIEGEG